MGMLYHISQRAVRVANRCHPCIRQLVYVLLALSLFCELVHLCSCLFAAAGAAVAVGATSQFKACMCVAALVDK
jgi:hypothetical protein